MQKGELDGIPETVLAVGAINGYRFCKRVANGWAECTVAGELVDGISAHDIADGAYGTVYMGDAINRVLSGAALTDGAYVATDADGKAIPLTGEHQYRAGKCEAAVSGTGLTSLVRLQPAINNEVEVP